MLNPLNDTEFLVIVAKCVLQNPDLPIDFVKDVLLSKYQDRTMAEPFKFDQI